MDVRKVGPFQVNPQFQKDRLLVESLRYRKGEPRAEQERKRILLRFIAYHYLLKNYFGKGYFDWRDTHAIYKGALAVLKEFSQPPGLSTFQEVKPVPAFGEVRAVTRDELLDDLKALPTDALPTLEAKREALLDFISQACERHVALRPPNYREIYNPNTYEPQPDNPLSRTMGKEMFREIMEPILAILRTHLDHCDPKVREALEEYVLKPELPFGVELPD